MIQEHAMKLPNLLKANSSLITIRTSLLSLLFAIVIGGAIIAAAGYSPLETYAAMFKGSLSSRKGIVLSLTQATPLIFTGLSFAIAYRVKLVNLGAEGQLYLGAMAAAVVGYSTNSPMSVLRSLPVQQSAAWRDCSLDTLEFVLGPRK